MGWGEGFRWSWASGSVRKGRGLGIQTGVGGQRGKGTGAVVGV